MSRALIRMATDALQRTELGADEALPCPFCGEQPTIEPYRRATSPTHRLIACDNDACLVNPSAAGPTRAEVLARWNRRTPA